MNRVTEDRLNALLERMPSLHVVVVGDLMLDVYLTGNVSRISPEAPVPVVHVVEERYALGGAANVAANVVAMGARCELLGCLGKDIAAGEVQRLLSDREGGSITPRLVERADRPTTTKTRVVARHQQVVRYDRERDDDLASDCVSELCGHLHEVIGHADVLILEDYNKGVLSTEVIRTAIAAAERAGVPTVVDPKLRNFFEYGGCTVFKPNALEIGAAMGTRIRAGDDEWLEEARQRLGASHLLITLGEEGMVLRSANGGSLRIPTVARDVFDVSGAGDTVTALVALSLAAGASIEEAAIIANHAAGVEVGKAGVATVSPSELRAAVRG